MPDLGDLVGSLEHAVVVARRRRRYRLGLMLAALLALAALLGMLVLIGSIPA